MTPPSLLVLIALLAAAAHAQLVDDFSLRAASIASGSNNLGGWRGGALAAYVPGGVKIISSLGWFEEVVAPGGGACRDVSGKALVFDYTPAAANQAVKVTYFEGCTAEGAARTATIKGPAAVTRTTATVPFAAFAGADTKKAFGVQWEGPITIHRVSIGAAAPTTSTTAAPTTRPTIAASQCISNLAEGMCGAEKVCPNGACCSQYGYCGTSPDHCGTKCQSQCDQKPILGLQTCGAAPSPTPSPTPVTPPPTTKFPTPPADSRLWVPSPLLRNPKFETGDFGMLVSCGWPGMASMTLDDGPSPLTPTILAQLASAGVKSTFFMVGTEVLKFPEIARSVLAQGHHVAQHTHTHPNLLTLSSAQVDDEITRASAAIATTVGVRPRYFRPPYGSINQAIMDKLTRAGYRVVYWGPDTNDWQSQTTVESITEFYRTTVVDPARKSYISLLQHDIQQKTSQGYGRWMNQVKANGFTLVPLMVCTNERSYM
ncbi:hypothetical protein H9P43_006628 [Blastocladiella emersonii ATCC 22665]|nr:hypothetical protein H9P43_006628 [Blastocladiella emersonii ATCC 22665]